MSPQLTGFAEADPSKVEAHMCMNMQPKKWKCREHKKVFLEAGSLHSEIQEYNSFEVYCKSKDISRYNTSFLESVGCVTTTPQICGLQFCFFCF